MAPLGRRGGRGEREGNLRPRIKIIAAGVANVTER
jgi:hypothetical protein